MKNLVLTLALATLSAGCAMLSSPTERSGTAPAGSMALLIKPDGEMNSNGVAKIEMSFRNVSDHEVYFPKIFRGGVTYVDEIREPPGPEIIETEDGELEEIEIIEEVEIVKDGYLFGRHMVSRGCGGPGCTSKNDFVLLAPGETYTQHTSVNTSDAKSPFTVKISRAIYSSDVKLPNMWLGNIESNELVY